MSKTHPHHFGHWLLRLGGILPDTMPDRPMVVIMSTNMDGPKGNAKKGARLIMDVHEANQLIRMGSADIGRLCAVGEVLNVPDQISYRDAAKLEMCGCGRIKLTKRAKFHSKEIKRANERYVSKQARRLMAAVRRMDKERGGL